MEGKEAREEKGLKVIINGVLSLRKRRGHGIKNIVFMKKKFLHVQPKYKFWTLQRIL